MPTEFLTLITSEQYNYLMGLSGIAAAFVVLVIWSRGL
jgi:hypothetical protein